MFSHVVTPRRLQTLRWYAERPRLWRQFLRVLQEKQHAASPSSAALAEAKAAATRWAEVEAVSEAEALERLTGSADMLSLAGECPADTALGHQRQSACPAKMGSGADFDLLYTLAEHSQCTRAVETGVAFGWSSFALLHSLAKRDGRLASTDMPYPLRDNDRHVGCVVPERLRSRWTLLRAPDRDALPRALQTLGPIDLCHYDSDKSESGRTWAYPRLWAALRPGGYFITDDVQDNLSYAKFCSTLELPPLVIRVPERNGFKYAGALVKRAQ